MGKQINAYKYRIIIIEPVNNHKNIELLEKVRSIASYLSKKPEEIYIKNLQTPVLKEITGIAHKEQMYGWIFMNGNGLSTDLNKPGFIIYVSINNKWEEVTRSNFKRILEIINK